jgi:hypothetical protein
VASCPSHLTTHPPRGRSHPHASHAFHHGGVVNLRVRPWGTIQRGSCGVSVLAVIRVDACGCSTTPPHTGAYTCGRFWGFGWGEGTTFHLVPPAACPPPDVLRPSRQVRCQVRGRACHRCPAEAGGEVPGVCRMIWRGLCRNCHQVGSRPSVTHLHPLHHETLEFDPVEVSWCPKRVGISLQEVIWWV